MKQKTAFRMLLANASTFLLILLWTYAALSKLFVYEDFRFQLMGHKLLANSAYLIAWLLPVFELIVAVSLAFRATMRTGMVVSAILLALFTGYILYMFRYYLHPPCSCGGIISELSWQQHVVFNMIFIGLSVVGYVASGSTARRNPDPENIHAHDPVIGGH